MVFNATFNNISVIPWLSFLFVEETGMDETVPDNTIYITNIYVLDKFRNRGIGEQLLLKAENEAKMRDISVCKFYFLKLKTRPLMKMTIRYIGTA
jgi:ribosomal protein S18 acetylase RimI-like enzyme